MARPVPLGSRTSQSLRPFVPARDFIQSRKFYSDLGFTVVPISDDLADVRLGECAFLLQNFYVKEWAKNFVFHARVDDLDAWWRQSIHSTLPPLTAFRLRELRDWSRGDCGWPMSSIHPASSGSLLRIPPSPLRCVSVASAQDPVPESGYVQGPPLVRSSSRLVMSRCDLWSFRWSLTQACHLDEAEPEGRIPPGLAKIARVLCQTGLNHFGVQIRIGCENKPTTADINGTA
jgi:hypothetical protein